MTLGALLVALFMKPALVVGAATLLARVCDRLGAAARHAIWAGAIIAIALLPPLTRVVPTMSLPAELSGVLSPAARSALDAPAIVPSREAPAPTRPDAGGEALDVTPLVGAMLLWVWGVVALVLVARRIGAQFSCARLIARTRDAPASLVAHCVELARELGIPGPVRVAISDQAPSPALAGILRPTIVVPASAAFWSRDEARAVLVHELSHVARRDAACNLLADIVSAMHWCNPAVRFAARKLRAEGERACDDHVLRTGSTPDGYASLLLAFAGAASAGPGLSSAATAMARPSELEARLLAILDHRVCRPPLRRALAVSLAAVGAALAVPVAAATLNADPVTRALAPEPDQRADSVAHPSSERLPVTPAEARAAGRTALSGPDSALARTLLSALTAAPLHEHDYVAERAAWTLAQARSGQLVAPLMQALYATDWRVRTQAAWAMGVARDTRAVPRLVELTEDPVWRVRAMAAAALRAIGDRRADAAMRAALSDGAWQVRMEAVEHLGSVGAGRYDAELRTMLDDRHVAVRRAAARALASD